MINWNVLTNRNLMKTSWGRRILLRRFRGHRTFNPNYEIQLSGEKILKVFHDNGITWNDNGEIPWILQTYLQWYHLQTPNRRGVLNFLRENVRPDALIFETGCGSAWILLWLAQNGFTNLHGSDIQTEAISVGRDLAKLAGARIEMWEDNAFSPRKVPENCDVILAIVWLYSAWAGNYSDKNSDLKNHDHLELLRNFISTYSDKVATGGYLIFDVVDKLSNLKPAESGIYPVRHSEEEVTSCLEKENFLVVKRYLESGHQFISTYIAQKR